MNTKKRAGKSEEPVEEAKPTSLVTQEEKILFYKAMLSDQPFVLTESLLAGGLQLELRALSVDDQMQVYDQLKKDQFNNLLTNDSNYLTALTCYRLALSVSKLNGTALFTDEVELDDDGKPKESVLTHRTKKIKAWPVFKVSAITEAFKKFEDKIVELTNAVMDPSFWEAAK